MEGQILPLALINIYFYDLDTTHIMPCKIIPFPITEEILQRQIHKDCLERFIYNDVTKVAFDSFVNQLSKEVTDRDPLIKKANNTHEKTNQALAWGYQFEAISYIEK